VDESALVAASAQKLYSAITIMDNSCDNDNDQVELLLHHNNDGDYEDDRVAAMSDSGSGSDKESSDDEDDSVGVVAVAQPPYTKTVRLTPRFCVDYGSRCSQGSS
jgi:hypothetical protein